MLLPLSLAFALRWLVLLEFMGVKFRTVGLFLAVTVVEVDVVCIKIVDWLGRWQNLGVASRRCVLAIASSSKYFDCFCTARYSNSCDRG